MLGPLRSSQFSYMSTGLPDAYRHGNCLQTQSLAPGSHPGSVKRQRRVLHAVYRTATPQTGPKWSRCRIWGRRRGTFAFISTHQPLEMPAG